MTADELSLMKKKVKNELKNYDEEFKKYFGHTPEKGQKEPMRKLYVYYKALKQNLSKEQHAQGSSAHDSHATLQYQQQPKTQSASSSLGKAQSQQLQHQLQQQQQAQQQQQ